MSRTEVVIQRRKLAVIVVNGGSSSIIPIQVIACRRPIEPTGLTKCLDAFSFFQVVLYQSLKARTISHQAHLSWLYSNK